MSFFALILDYDFLHSPVTLRLLATAANPADLGPIRSWQPAVAYTEVLRSAFMFEQITAHQLVSSYSGGLVPAHIVKVTHI